MLQHFALARREASQSLFDRLKLRAGLASQTVLLDPFLTASSKSESLNGFARKFTAPAFIARTLVGMSPLAGNEYDLTLSSRRRQRLLQFEAIQSGQPNVENQAARHGKTMLLQKSLC